MFQKSEKMPTRATNNSMFHSLKDAPSINMNQSKDSPKKKMKKKRKIQEELDIFSTILQIQIKIKPLDEKTGKRRKVLKS